MRRMGDGKDLIEVGMQGTGLYFYFCFIDCILNALGTGGKRCFARRSGQRESIILQRLCMLKFLRKCSSFYSTGSNLICAVSGYLYDKSSKLFFEFKNNACLPRTNKANRKDKIPPLCESRSLIQMSTLG